MKTIGATACVSILFNYFIRSVRAYKLGIMAYTPEQIAHVAESFVFRYTGEILGCLSAEENLQILHNINTLEGIPMSWIEAWEMDGRRGFWGQMDRKTEC